MNNVSLEPDEHVVLHKLTLQDLRTCELAISMLLRRRELFGDEVLSRLHHTLDRLSYTRVLSQLDIAKKMAEGADALVNIEHPIKGEWP